MVERWGEECPDKNVFWCVLRILRLTAQGTNHQENCEWKTTTENCPICREETLQELRENWSEYGYESNKRAVDDVDDFTRMNDIQCNHVRCDCVAPHSNLEDYVVYKELKKLIAHLELEPRDMHPEITAATSKNSAVVRDLVHPSMYCHIREDRDEKERYQWLPSEVSIQEGEARFVSRINNLDESIYSYRSLEKCLTQFIPSLYSVLGQETNHLQVIVKIGSIELDEENSNYPGGSWHIEGMPYEHIAATCLHYLETSGITDSYLEFRKPVFINELEIDYPQNDELYTCHHDGQMSLNLGLVKAQEGYSVVFPNFLQHRVKPFQLREGVRKAKRTIIAFFVVDPEERIVSTADNPLTASTLEEAREARIKLMIQRKYFVDKLNRVVYEREYSLCEH